MTDPEDSEPTGSEASDPARQRAADEVTLRVARIRDLSERLIATQAELKEAQRQHARTAAELARLRGRRLVRVALAISDRARRWTGRSGGRRAAASAAVAAAAGATPETPRAFRAAFEGKVGNAAGASSGSLRVAIVGPGVPPPGRSADEADAVGLASAFESLGWTTSATGLADVEAGATTANADLVLVRTDAVDIRDLPDGTVTAAWVEGPPDPWLAQAWFDEFDLVIAASAEAAAEIGRRSVHRARVVVGRADMPATPADAAATLRAALLDWVRAPHIDVAIGPPDWEVAPKWGDLHFGRAIQRALQRRGYPTRLRLRPAWDAPAAGRADVAIHVFGLVERPTFPDQVSVLWIISHPDLVTDAMVARYDPVFVASDGFAAELARRTGRSILPLHQATDPDRFQPTAGGPRHELLFVANSRRTRRPIVDELTPTARDLAVYGRSWTPELLDPRHLRGEHIPNDRLAAYYAAADIVLNDHWADMAKHGFLSNRLYDAAASGAFVLSDHAPGIEDEFDGGIVTYRDGAELRALVERYLADPAARADHARRARAAVLTAHTFDRRVEEILRVIGPRLGGSPIPVDAAADPSAAGAAP